MQIPHFPEVDRPLIQSLQSVSDAELARKFQCYPDSAKYFTAFFCRYSAITYSIVHHVSSVQIQADYMFALAWQKVFERLQQIEEKDLEKITWQNWVVTVVGEFINTVELLPVEKIQYRLAEISPPFRCYVERSLNLMQPLLRLVLVMGNNWHWSAAQIANHLRSEGEEIDEMDVPLYLAESQKAFEKNLPTDLLEIYGTPTIPAEDFDINTAGDIIDLRAAPS